MRKITRREMLKMAGIAGAGSILAACAPSAPAAQPTTAPGQATAAPTKAAATANFNATGLPIVKEKVTLNIIGQKAGPLTSDFSKMVLFDQVEKDTNVHIEWQNIASADYQEKKNLILASGTLPDAFWNTGFSDFDLVTYGTNGTLIPLEDLIAKYAPNLTKVFEKRAAIKQAVTAPDGHIYSLPFSTEMGIGADPFFLSINKAWLDKLGLKIPTTLDEFHDVLVAFKTKDPNGNGKADEFPLSFMFNWWCADMADFISPFGVPDNLDHRIVRDGKVIYSAAQPEYKAALAYLHKWYAEGLIDPESFTQDAKAYLAKGKSESETLGSYIWWETEEVVGPDRAKDYTLVPPLAGPSGKALVGRSNGSEYGRAAFAITKANKNPEITMRWVDTFYDPYMSAQVIWGPIGVIYKKDDNGLLVNLPLPAGVSMGEFRQTVAPEGVGVILREDFGKVVDMEPRAKQRVKDLETIYVPHMEPQQYPSVFFLKQDLDILETHEKDIKDFVNQKRASWIVDGGIDTDWDGYLSQLDKMGLKDMLKVYQDALDRYNKK